MARYVIQHGKSAGDVHFYHIRILDPFLGTLGVKIGVKGVKNYPCLIETIHIYKMNWVFSWVQWINTIFSFDATSSRIESKFSSIRVQICNPLTHFLTVVGFKVTPIKPPGPFPYFMNVVSMNISDQMLFQYPCLITCSPLRKLFKTSGGSRSILLR